MTASGRRARVAVATAGLVLLLAGSVVGSDDWFPFGPFRMYATSGRTTGAVRTATLVGVTADGDELQIEAEHVGLRRAELEGQLRRFGDDPHLMGALADHVSAEVGEPLVAVRLEEQVRPVVDRRPTGEVRREVVATWER